MMFLSQHEGYCCNFCSLRSSACPDTGFSLLIFIMSLLFTVHIQEICPTPTLFSPSLVVCMLLLPNFSPITAAFPSWHLPSYFLLLSPSSCCIFEPKLTTTSRAAQRFLSKLSLSITSLVGAHNCIFQSPDTFFSLYVAPSSLSLDEVSSPNYTFSCKQPSLLLVHDFHSPLQNSPSESSPVIREAKWSWGIAVNFMLNPCTMTVPASSLEASVSSSLSKTMDQLFISLNKIYLESIPIMIYLSTSPTLYTFHASTFSPLFFFPHCFEKSSFMGFKLKGKGQCNKSESPGIRGSLHQEMGKKLLTHRGDPQQQPWEPVHGSAGWGQVPAGCAAPEGTCPALPAGSAGALRLGSGSCCLGGEFPPPAQEGSHGS